MQKDIAGRKKYGLWRVTKSVEELARELTADVAAMKRHVFTAAICWKALSEDLRHLRPGMDVLTYEDFQRNLELSFAEMPTSMGFSANGISLALYPIGVKFKRPSPVADVPVADVPIENGAIVFLSPDLRHDSQQIERFEAKYVEWSQSQPGGWVINLRIRHRHRHRHRRFLPMPMPMPTSFFCRCRCKKIC